MKFLKLMVILLIPLLFCSVAYASDAMDTSDNIAISQQNIDLDNAIYVLMEVVFLILVLMLKIAYMFQRMII